MQLCSVLSAHLFPLHSLDAVLKKTHVLLCQNHVVYLSLPKEDSVLEELCREPNAEWMLSGEFCQSYTAIKCLLCTKRWMSYYGELFNSTRYMFYCVI